jgi:hypothetical protein
MKNEEEELGFEVQRFFDVRIRIKNNWGTSVIQFPFIIAVKLKNVTIQRYYQ